MKNYKTGIDKSILKNIKNTSTTVFVSGNFNILHPGHIRLLHFAKNCGDYLIVGINKDESAGVFIREKLRHSSVSSISIVDYAFIMTDSLEDTLKTIKPNVVVKGKEYEFTKNIEEPILKRLGGKLLFSSGEIRFSSIEIIKKEYHNEINPINKPLEYINRHNIDKSVLITKIKNFKNINVVVIGDLIVDEYISCEALGMSQEDPTIVVAPINTDMFLGGAGVVAAHARGLGARVTYIGVVGNDDTANFANEKLINYGVDTILLKDVTRPTTIKQRYRAKSKTLLRVSHLRQHEISNELIFKMMNQIELALKDADLLVFADFNYGNLPQILVDDISLKCKKFGVQMVADSQSSSQSGDISRFKDMLLITPTEYEANLAVDKKNAGLAILANDLQSITRSQNLFITLGAEGLFIRSSRTSGEIYIDDQLPAFNNSPKDVSGAGDSLFICSSLALISGANIWESAYIGSVASAYQVGNVGNIPLQLNQLIQELSK